MTECETPKEYCILQGCTDGQGPWCIRCGHNKYENERRRRLPLVTGEDGLSRKYVGVEKEAAWNE